MKNIIYSYPQSSFLSLEKDMGLIVDMLMKNNNLKKLLYYTSRDCMSRPPLTEDETLELFGKNIKIVPKLKIDPTVLTYITISFDSFSPNLNNPEFRDNLIEFDIICHNEQWQLQDFQLRPYKIAAELDTMFNNKHLTGIGTLQFVGATQSFITDEYAGLCLLYKAIHGRDDKIGTLNPRDEQRLADNYNEMFNN